MSQISDTLKHTSCARTGYLLKIHRNTKLYKNISESETLKESRKSDTSKWSCICNLLFRHMANDILILLNGCNCSSQNCVYYPICNAVILCHSSLDDIITLSRTSLIRGSPLVLVGSHHYVQLSYITIHVTVLQLSSSCIPLTLLTRCRNSWPIII